MEAFLKSAGLVIGVIAGLLGLIKSIMQIQKQYREDKELSAILASRQFKTAMLLVVIGVAVLAGVVWWSAAGDANNVIVQIWDVELDEKHAIVASQKFDATTDGNLSDEKMKEIGRWFVGQVGQRYQVETDELQVSVHVPADLRTERVSIEATPPGSDQIYFWVVSGAKSRAPLNEQALAELNQDFFLEFSRPGYQSKVMEVRWGQELNESFVVKPKAISLGIEEFTGEPNSIAIQLTNYFSSNPRLSILDPRALERLKKKIADEKAFIRDHPMAQTGIRSSLGVDLIMTGHF